MCFLLKLKFVPRTFSEQVCSLRGVNRMVRYDIDSHTQYDICRYLKTFYDTIQEYIDRYNIHILNNHLQFY